MNRFFLPAGQWEGGFLTITGEEAKHCVQIMRTVAGDEIELFDGAGRSAVVRVVSASKKEVLGEVVREVLTAPPSVPLHLAQAIPKGKTMDLIIQKAVELGVRRITPLLTKHTVAKADDSAKKQEKWQRVALEACKQCGQNWMPEVMEARSFVDYLGSCDDDRGLYLAGALLPGMVSLKEALGGVLVNPELPSRVELLVGPEGDFSFEEYEAVVASVFQGVTLGELVLRSETAALFMISASKAFLEI